MSSALRLTWLAATVLLQAAALAQQPAAHADTAATHVLLDPGKLDWKPAPDVLPAGARAAVLQGDPTKPGLFTMRLRFPDGYRVAPHFHDANEHLTVVSGTLAVGLGDEWNDGALRELGAGGFAMMPAGTRHFARARGETTIQVHAEGPWRLTYVNPADDPRKTVP